MAAKDLQMRKKWVYHGIRNNSSNQYGQRLASLGRRSWSRNSLQAVYWSNVLRIKRIKEQNRADNAAMQGCDRKWNSISLVPEKSETGLSNNYLLIKSILSSLIQSLLPTCCWLNISRVAAKELKFKFNSG